MDYVLTVKNALVNV